MTGVQGIVIEECAAEIGPVKAGSTQITSLESCLL